MKAEAARFIEQANIVLGRAATMLSVGLNESAAREAYMACFHAAQAYIFERTGRVVKTHKGVQVEFLRLTNQDPRADQALRRFLSQSYEYKSVADYFAGPNPVTPADEATEAVATERAFIAHLARLTPIFDG